MAAENKPHTLIRVQRYRKGRLIFRHGNMPPIYALPSKMLRSFDVFCKDEDFLNGYRVLREDDYRDWRLNRRILPTLFLPDDILIALVHPATFRAYLTNNYKDLVFDKYQR